MIRILKYLGISIICLIVIAGFFYFKYKPSDKIEWGLTFSYQEAKGLGFDDKQMFLDILSDLKPKKIRLMTYWDDLEKSKGQYDFSNIDWQLDQAQKNNVDVLLVVGRKQPRWPECHEPDWFKNQSLQDQNQAVLDFVKNSVEHFKTNSAIKYWQVENEPYFSFGSMCPTIPKNLFDQEVSFVKSLDSRPVVVTDSGDRGSWIPTAKSGADILGATFYRVSYDAKYGGYYKYPIPALFYRIKAGILQTFTPTKQVFDIELQMEPWFTNGALNMPIDQQKQLMNQKVFQQNIEYARVSGFPQHYLWGVEWWYWMAKHNNDWGMWSAAKDFFGSNN